MDNCGNCAHWDQDCLKIPGEARKCLKARQAHKQMETTEYFTCDDHKPKEQEDG